MKNSDIIFINNNIKFNFRVGLIIQNKNRFLLQKSIKDDFFGLIGGRVQLGENTKKTAIREAKEELDIDINEDNLKINFISENFFSYNTQKFHEILYIYKYRIDDFHELAKKDNFPCCDKISTTMQWFDIHDIKDLDLRPCFIKTNIEKNQFKFVINAE